ncbi:MAG: hypothetical protein M1840_002434 [Geoglossum simile]|nr:MAG: hypothetical protein M1840_002434 [Geoglossum simile]
MNISRSGSLLTIFRSGDDEDDIYTAAVIGFLDIEKGGEWVEGQSVGICLNDVILLSRLLAKHSSPFASSSPSDPPSWTSADLSANFSRYDTLHRPIVDRAHKKAIQQWENVKDISRFAFKLREWFVWLTLLVMGSMFGEGEGYDSLKEEV